MLFNGKQVKAILLIFADMMNETKIRRLLKGIIRTLRESAEKISNEESFALQKKTGGPCIFSAADWEIVKVDSLNTDKEEG